MPIYEYRCNDCDTVVEKMQKFSDPPLSECERCGGRLEKLISAPGLQFKGSGWYITDYARAGSGKNGSDKGEKGSDKSSSEKSDTKKADSKPESKSTTKKD